MAQGTLQQTDPLKTLVGGVLAAATASLPGFFGANQQQPTAQNLPPKETRGPEVNPAQGKAPAPSWLQSPIVWLGAALLAVMVWSGTRR